MGRGRKEGRSNPGSKGDWLEFPVVVGDLGPPNLGWRTGCFYLFFFKEDFLF